MRDFPSCFGENGVQVADASCSTKGIVSKVSQNLVTCIYQCRLLGKSCLVTLNWSKNMMGQSLSIEITNLSHMCLCKAEIKPSLFSRKKGSKSLEVNSSKIDFYWDLSQAKFGSGPEPLDGYYLALVCNAKMVLVIGDLKKEAFDKTCAKSCLSSSMFISKREHIFGKKLYSTKAQFFDDGPVQELVIECDTNGVDDPSLVIHVDGKSVMKVKNLVWKFRGNCRISVDGLPVEIFWDVHNWLFGDSFGTAVFMFQTCLSVENLGEDQRVYDSSMLLPWHQPKSFKDDDPQSTGHGFSLILYAWKNV